MRFKGHSKKYCSKNKKEISLRVIDHESSVTADKYLRNATINNRSVSCLLDTGASSCLLKESLAERLGINMTPCKKDLYSLDIFDSQVLQSLGAAVVDFQIGEDNESRWLLLESMPIAQVLTPSVCCEARYSATFNVMYSQSTKSGKNKKKNLANCDREENLYYLSGGETQEHKFSLGKRASFTVPLRTPQLR
ncbi:hypothetical protein CEXT_296451 [Caerostris extrusa]|uniref:Uncharacterized protein n=1 Tax=Caerostris extrusa TaxID=172846 RepID=A0AAV4NWX5_CAEEX|nr:hypothetical protein CEXT_296451 [Caerostris extrusa]